MAQAIELHPVILVVDDDLHPAKVRHPGFLSSRVENTHRPPGPI